MGGRQSSRVVRGNGEADSEPEGLRMYAAVLQSTQSYLAISV